LLGESAIPGWLEPDVVQNGNHDADSLVLG
jgi:hypothetical protein